MKTFVLFIGLVVFFSALSRAQEVKMTDESVGFSKGTQEAIVTTIPFAKRSIVEKQLKSEMKSWGGKVVVSGDEYQVVQGRIKAMSDKHFDGYAKIIETADEIKVAFAVDLGGKYMNAIDHPVEYKAIRERVRKFGAKTGALSLDEDLDADKKALKSLEKEEKKIEKSIESSNKEIENYQKKIKQAEKDIEAKKTELNAKQEEIRVQNQQISDRKQTAKKIK